MFCFLHFVSLVHADTNKWSIAAQTDDCQVSESGTAHPPWDTIMTEEVSNEGIFGYYLTVTTYYGVGLRFVNVAIPKDATIVDAFLEFDSVDEWSDAPVNIRIAGDDEANCSTFSTVADYNGRARTSYVSWTGIPTWSIEESYNSSDIASILQAIVNRADWVSGNAMGFFIEDNGTSGGRRQFGAFDSPSYPPDLYVSWSITVSAEDYVDSQTNVDSSADKGTHSSFTAQKATDWTNDSLIEANTNTTIANNSENFVDANSSDIDSHTGHGTSSNFTAQQDALIAYNDTLTEANTAASASNTTVLNNGFEVGVWNSLFDQTTGTWIRCLSGTPTGYAPHAGTNATYCGSTNDGSIYTDDVDMTTATKIYVTFWWMDDDLDGGTDFEFYVYDGSAYDLIVQLDATGQTYAEDTWYQYSWSSTDSQYFDTTFRLRFAATPESNEAAFIDDVVIIREVTPANNYELDYEFSWTTADYDEANEYLCIRTNSYSGTAENLGVDVWDGSWKAISVALTASAWNNISITTNLTGATIYFRFIGKTESSDTAQNTWVIECNLIHTWSVGVNYELDLEEQFSSANFSRTSVELCVRMGAYNTTENLRLDYWNASTSAWIVAVATLTTNVWNNVSVKTYTSNASVTFTVRFVGVTESGDTEHSAWDKDACLLHTWDAGTANLAPTIPDLRLSATTDTSNISQIDVNTWYDWEVNVSDSGTLLDIVNVTIRLKDNPTDSIITDSAAYNRTGEYWFNYDNVSNVWQWYSGASWTTTSDWLDNANCAAPTKTESSGYYLFRTKLAKSAVHTATWGFSASAYDSGNNVTSKNFTSITVNAYSSLTMMSGNATHTWVNATAGVNDILIDQGAIYFNVTVNYLFKIQAEGDGNLIKGSDYIVLGNVTIHKDTLGSSIPLTTTYADVVGLTSQALGEDVQLSLKLWLDSPANQPVGAYIYELQIQVTEQ